MKSLSSQGLYDKNCHSTNRHSTYPLTKHAAESSTTTVIYAYNNNL